MERNLGLCEGCESWEEFAADSRNGEFNRKCLEIMLEWYKANRRNFEKRRDSYERHCIEEIQEVYKVGRELVEWAKNLVLYDAPRISPSAIRAKSSIVMEADEEERIYTVIRKIEGKAIEFEKRCAERGCSVLYQLLRRLDVYYKVNEWLREELCKRLEKHFSNQDSGFFNMLNNRLYTPDTEELLIKCINKLLAKKVTNSRRKEALLFSKKAHWKAVWEVLNERGFAIAEQFEGFARFIADNDKIIYADEELRIKDSSNIRNAQETPHKERVRKEFEKYLDEEGL